MPEDKNRYLPGLLIAVLFFGVGLAIWGDFGLTWDELSTQKGGTEAFENFPKLFVEPFQIRWTYHDLRGYYFVFDLLKHFTYNIGKFVSPDFSITDGHHLFNLILCSLSGFLLFLLVLRITNENLYAICATVSFLLYPYFIGHSQNNPKDVIPIFTFLLSFNALLCLIYENRIRDVFYVAVSLALAYSSRVISFSILPIFYAFTIVYKRKFLISTWKNQLAAILLSLPLFVLFWPYLWDAPVPKLIDLFNFITAYIPKMGVLFHGDIFKPNQLPRYYFLTCLFYATPFLYLISMIFAFLPNKNQSIKTIRGFGTIYVLFLVAVEWVAKSRYDEIRHFLVLIPGISILVSVGLVNTVGLIQNTFPSKHKKVFIILASAILVIYHGSILVYLHPYQYTFKNELMTLLIGNDNHNYFGRDYWASSYKNGAHWINANSKKDAKIVVTIAPHVARYYLKRAIIFEKELDFCNDSRPLYLMYVTRPAYYDRLIRQIENSPKLRPVYIIKKWNGTLLKIYHNRHMDDTKSQDPLMKSSGD